MSKKDDFCSLYRMVTRPRSPKSEQLFIVPKKQYIEIGQDPSLGSRDKTLFWLDLTFQRTGVTLKVRARSPKSYQFLTPSMKVWLKFIHWFGRLCVVMSDL